MFKLIAGFVSSNLYQNFVFTFSECSLIMDWKRKTNNSITTKSYKYYCGKCRTFSKSEYVISHRPMWVEVASLAWLGIGVQMLRCEGPWFDSGEPPFLRCQFYMRRSVQVNWDKKQIKAYGGIFIMI